jgi:fatty acid desaturase
MDNDPTLYHSFILELVGMLGLVGVIDYLLNKIEFKKWVHFWILQGTINYVVFLAAGYFLNWFGFRISNIIIYTITFLISFLTIVYNTYKIQKQEEEMINRLLEQRNTLNK